MVRDADRTVIDTAGQPPLVSEGDLLVDDTTIAEGVKTLESGQVIAVKDGQVVMRIARPYRVSTGAVLHIDNGDLVQRGDGWCCWCLSGQTLDNITRFRRFMSSLVLVVVLEKHLQI